MATHDPAHRSSPEPGIPRADRESPAIETLFRDEAEFDTVPRRTTGAVRARERMAGIDLIPILPSDREAAAAFPDEVDVLDTMRPAAAAHAPQTPEIYTAVPRPVVTGSPRTRFSSITMTALGVAALSILVIAGGVSVFRDAPWASAPSPADHPDVPLEPSVKPESLGTTGATATPGQPVAPLRESAPSTAERQTPLTLEPNTRPAMEPNTRSAAEPRDNATAEASAEPIAPPPAVTVPESPRLTPLIDLPESTIATSTVPPSPPAAPLTAEKTTAAAPQPVVNEAAAIRVALSRFAAGYSDLDPAAVSAVWPSVDRAGLSRAFSTLDAQQVTFDRCDIQVNGSVGNATCVGTAMWLPKIGGQTRELARTWKFVLKNGAGTWQIVTAEAR